MIHTLIALVVFVLVACLLWWALNKIMATFGLDARIATVVQVIFVVLCVLSALQYLGVVAVL